MSGVSRPRAGVPRYLPAEDTYLLRDALATSSGDRCLEIGFGSGALLADVSSRFRLAVGTDLISVEDTMSASAPGIDVVLADKASCFRSHIFDLVFFNPPYLPSSRVEDQAVDGGRSGTEVPLAFLEDGLRVMKDDGTMMVLLSDEGDLDSFVSRCRALDLASERVAEKRLFFEKLVVLRLRRTKRG